MPRTPALNERDQADKPPHVRDRTRPYWRYASSMEDLRARMYRTLMSVDDMMGALKDRLAALGELDNTPVIFTSDNGFMWGDNHLKAMREAYEASLRVPMLASYPDVLEPNTTDRRIAALADVAATVFDATGVTSSYPVDGQSLLQPSTRHRALVEHYAGGSYSSRAATWFGWWSPRMMYRTNSYAAAGTDQGTTGCFDGKVRTICQRYTAGFGKVELYDTANDPGQLANLASDGAWNATTQQLATSLAQARSCVADECVALESRPTGTLPRRVGKLRLSGPSTPQAGVNERVTLSLTNRTARRMETVRMVLESNDYWVATPLTSTRRSSLAPGRTFTTTWKIRFKGTGFVALSAEARYGWQAVLRRSSTMLPVRVT